MDIKTLIDNEIRFYIEMEWPLDPDEILVSVSSVLGINPKDEDYKEIENQVYHEVE